MLPVNVAVTPWLIAPVNVLTPEPAIVPPKVRSLPLNAPVPVIVPFRSVRLPTVALVPLKVAVPLTVRLLPIVKAVSTVVSAPAAPAQHRAPARSTRW